MQRRVFIKMSCAAGVILGLPSTLQAFVSSDECAHCRIDLSDARMVARSGNCRNCGADAHSGNRGLSHSLFEDVANREIFTMVAPLELPFPALEIGALTKKPCLSLRQITPGVSKVRKTPFARN